MGTQSDRDPGSEEEPMQAPCLHGSQSASVDFQAEANVPAGRTDRVLSGISGKPLIYFTPDPLPELLRRYQVSRTHGWSDFPASSVLLCRTAARRGSFFEVDHAFLAQLCRAVIQPGPLGTLLDLMRVGGEGVTTRKLRQEIVFAGGISASDAVHIYAPYATVPSLMQSMIEPILMADEYDAILFASILGFFGAHTHPFVDGNGRWTRATIVAVGASIGRTLPSISSVIFQSVCKTELTASVWPRARSGGLSEYLQLAFRFDEAFLTNLCECGALQAAESVALNLQRSARSRRDHLRVMEALCQTQELRVDPLRSSLSLSMRAASGLIGVIAEASCGLVTATDQGLSAVRLFEAIEAAARAAKQETFKGK